MAFKRAVKTALRGNYGNARKATDIKYIVIHYTANDGDSDQNNANYFAAKLTKSSAHYFVDDDSVTLSVPELYVAYSVGGSKYGDCSKTGGGKLHGKAINANTLNIEMCDTKKDGKVMATEQTLQNTAELTAELMEKYHIDINHVIRHFDVTGKKCPAYFVNDAEWEKFKDRIKAAMEVSMEITIKLNGVKKKVEAIQREGNNYVKLQDLRDDKIIIGYDSFNKLPTIEVK